jgi:glycogen operon protein
MLLAGDELGHTQSGNNNAYCQDNQTTWIDWSRESSDPGLFRFVRSLIRFRREHPILRKSSFVPDGGGRRIIMRWGGTKPDAPDWSAESRLLALHLYEESGDGHGDQIYVLANAHWDAAECELPRLTSGAWRRFADTFLAAPHDVADVGHEIEIQQDKYIVNPRSVVILVGKGTVC